VIVANDYNYVPFLNAFYTKHFEENVKKLFGCVAESKSVKVTASQIFYLGKYRVQDSTIK